METNYVLFIDGAESMASLDQERGVLYQFVYIGKKFVFLKRTFVFNKPVGPNNVKKCFFTMWFQDFAISL